MSLLANDSDLFLKIKDFLNRADELCWQKLANSTAIPNIMEKIRTIQNGQSNSDALLDYLIRNKITTNQAILLITKANIVELLISIKGLEPLKIVHFTPNGSDCTIFFFATITLFVEVTGSVPVYKWCKGNETLSQTSNHITIDRFSTCDEGLYRCFVQHDSKYAKGEVGEICKSFLLKLKPTQPFILHASPDTVLCEGGKLELKCEVYGSPLPYVCWYFHTRNKISQLESPVIDEVLLENSGYYECCAWNHLGKCSSRLINVQVTAKVTAPTTPDILVHPTCGENPARSIGERVVLTCVAKCKLNVQFNWSINGKFLKDIDSLFYNIINKTDEHMCIHRSFLTYSLNNNDPLELKILCFVQSPDGGSCSHEVELAVRPTKGIKVFTAHNKLALLIGNCDYKATAQPLFTPKADLKRIAKQLQELDFEVLMVSDIGVTDLNQIVNIFGQMISPGDYVFFMYAGHGYYNGEDQLMTIPESKSSMQETLSFTKIRTLIQFNNPALFFCLLDMCREIVSLPTQTPLEMNAAPASKNYICLHATSEGYAALENPNKSSVLASALLLHMNQPVDVFELCTRVIEDIGHKQLTVRNVQIPKVTSDLVERRSLSDNKTSTSIEIPYWHVIKRLPKKQIAEVSINETDKVKMSIHFSFEIEDVPSNVIFMHVTVNKNCSSDLQISFDPNFPCKQEGRPTLFKITDAQKLKEPFQFTINIRLCNVESSFEETVKMLIDLPGIASLGFTKSSGLVQTMRSNFDNI